MKKLALTLLTLTACGGALCDRLNTARDTFFAGKTECSYTEGGSSLTIHNRGNTSCKDTSGCSAEDLKTLETYVTCLSNAQVCTAGHEKQAATEAATCAFDAANKLSAECQAWFSR